MAMDLGCPNPTLWIEQVQPGSWITWLILFGGLKFVVLKYFSKWRTLDFFSSLGCATCGGCKKWHDEGRSSTIWVEMSVSDWERWKRLSVMLHFYNIVVWVLYNLKSYRILIITFSFHMSRYEVANCQVGNDIIISCCNLFAAIS